MDERSTESLMDFLKSADQMDLEHYQNEYLSGTCRDFPSYMDALLTEKKLKRQDVFQRADLPQKYGYKLLSGESHTTDRDKILRLLIAMGLTLKETQRALELYGLPILYPKSMRDAVIIIALNRGISSVDTVNDWLREQGEPELTRSGE